MRSSKTIAEERAFHPSLGCSASLVAQTVQNLPAMDSLEREWLPTPSTLAWKIPWTEEPGRRQSLGSQRVRHDSATNTFIFHFHFYPL